MSKLCLSRQDIEKAVKQYYSDYERELYKMYDFDSFELWVDNARKGYTGVEYTVSERVTAKETLPNKDGSKLAEDDDVQPSPHS